MNLILLNYDVPKEIIVIKINKFGNSLIELTRKANLKILNGRTLGDSGGAPTSFHYNGNSVVDYGIAGESYFMVSPTSNSISDHADIQMHLEILNNNHNSSKKHNIPKVSF